LIGWFRCGSNEPSIFAGFVHRKSGAPSHELYRIGLIEMTHALVLVGNPLPEGAEESATTILSAFDASPIDGKILSVGRASELLVEGVEDRESTITAAVREALPEVDVALVPLANRRKKLLCADMDATIVVGETIDELADAVGIKDEVAAITERAMRGELDFEQALDARVAMLKVLGLRCLKG